MKRPPRPDYVLRQAWLLVRASPWLAAVSSLTIALALALVGVFAMVLFNASQLLHDLGRSLTLTVYLRENALDTDIAAVQAKVRTHAGVKGVRVLTADQDRTRNTKLLPAELLQGLDEAAIPGQPVIEVDLNADLGSRADVDTLSAWCKSLKAVQSVEDAEFGAEKLRLLFAFVEIARTIGLVLTFVLLASAMFFVFSTIRLSVFSRKEEIEILALVGATPVFIRVPFLVEGVLQGLCGSLLAAGLLGLLHLELLGLIRDVHMLNLSATLLPPGMIVWLVLGGPLVGLAAAAVSVGRYLKV